VSGRAGSQSILVVVVTRARAAFMPVAKESSKA
jgi:hypothetical protein